jgi:hypothetical protein
LTLLQPEVVEVEVGVEVVRFGVVVKIGIDFQISSRHFITQHHHHAPSPFVSWIPHFGHGTTSSTVAFEAWYCSQLLPSW